MIKAKRVKLKEIFSVFLLNSFVAHSSHTRIVSYFYFILLSVVWKSAVESFEYALKFLEWNEACRNFVERYAGAVVGILSEQSPAKIGMGERNCVQETLNSAILIVVNDLNIQLRRADNAVITTTTPTNPTTTTTAAKPLTVPAICGECILLDTMLSHIFNKKKAFYKGPKGNMQNHHHPNNNNNNNNWHHNQPNNQSMVMGYPEVRIRNIEKFRASNGFNVLYTYLLARLPYCVATSISATTAIAGTNGTVSTASTTTVTTTNMMNHSNVNTNLPPTTGASMTAPSYSFPSLETIHHILTALFDTFPFIPLT